MTERDKVKQKIIALLNKTTDAGATEQEALLSAQKAAELMEHYDIEATELDIKNSKAVQKTVTTQNFGRGSVGTFFVVNLAKLFDCKIWSSGSGGKEFNFFGFPEDTEVAAYLLDVLSKTVINEIERYKQSDQYQRLKDLGYHGRTLTSSFHKGIESRISERLKELAYDKKEHVESKTGTALVLLKEQQVEDDFDDLGLSLRTIRRNVRSRSDAAYNSGQNRGNRVNINTGLNGGAREALQ